ncbi:MAG TPA: hypothetical protein VM260_18185 [Pirellula sp.]|nr:hypothetical protein [Pirellula sp.]
MFHPQSDRWLDHFDWSVNGTLIVGLTDVGAATINLLRMNRPQLVKVRYLWIIVGNTHRSDLVIFVRFIGWFGAFTIRTEQFPNA